MIMIWPRRSWTAPSNAAGYWSSTVPRTVPVTCRLTLQNQTAITLTNRPEFPENTGQNFRNPQVMTDADRGYPMTARPMTDKEQRRLKQWRDLERSMKRQTIPQTDSIRKLADFRDTHDVTDFDDELEEVAESVFDPRGGAVVKLHLEPSGAAAVRRLAESKGIASAELIEEWVPQKFTGRECGPNKAAAAVGLCSEQGAGNGIAFP